MVRTLSTQKRAVILHTALRLFVEKGVQNTSTAEIAKEAGIAAGTLFLYFATKQELLDELILDIARQQAEAVNTILEPSLSARDSFFKIWYSSIRWFLDHLDAYHYVQQVRDTGMISEAAVQESGKLFAYYYIAIQKGLEEGSLKPYPVALIGGFLYQDLVAVVNFLKMQLHTAQEDEVIHQGFEIFWDGIKTSNQTPPEKETQR